MAKGKKPTSGDLARIQGGNAKKNNGKTQKGSFPARIQRVVDKEKSK